jgi:hypothetical protein
MRWLDAGFDRERLARGRWRATLSNGTEIGMTSDLSGEICYSCWRTNYE